MELNGLVVDDEGTQCWYQNGLRHRTDGPAMTWANGDQCWYQNDQLHREDGPAVVCADAFQHWFLRGQMHTFDRWLGLTNVNDAQKLFLLLKYS